MGRVVEERCCLSLLFSLVGEEYVCGYYLGLQSVVGVRLGLVLCALCVGRGSLRAKKVRKGSVLVEALAADACVEEGVLLLVGEGVLVLHAGSFLLPQVLATR